MSFFTTELLRYAGGESSKRLRPADLGDNPDREPRPVGVDAPSFARLRCRLFSRASSRTGRILWWSSEGE
jgi:hypothetical protein